MMIRFLSFCLLFSGIYFFAGSAHAQSKAAERDLYEFKIYHFDNPEQEKSIDQFLEKAYIPALHRAGIKHVGVFKPVEDDSTHGKMIYVFIPYASADQFMKVPMMLEKDTQYNADGRGYLDAPHDNPPYSRIETILVKAFEGMPKYRPNKLKTSPSEKIYELRSYEGATENIFKNKMQMFNKGEIDIFANLGFNALFYGEVIAGSKMPNLMYMTTFENKASRDAHWEAFGKDPAWKKMSSMEEYQNNVSHIDVMFLHPTSYSDL